MEKKERKTSWGNVAPWYDKLLASESTYQKEVILPKLLGLMDIRKGEHILDLACGQGFFTAEFAKAGAQVTGADISPELIQIAQKNFSKDIHFIVSAADKLTTIKDGSFDAVTIILALQNIGNLKGVVEECSRVLKSGGKLFIVLNHPAFRVPQKSDWGYDAKKAVQYRRVEKYLSESMMKIDMNPGEKNIKKKIYTTSYHRALQQYFSIFHTSGFLVARLEEWVSHKKSQAGPKQKIEDTARKEIPMFLCIEAVKSR
jgi:ubiquinone/menaquinone biosynthesis C-methylase UbiE